MNNAYKKALIDFEDHCRRIAEHTVINALETDQDKAKRIKRVRKDFAYFASYYFPHYVTSPSAKFHIEAANVIKNSPNLRALLKWFRGASKSSTINVMVTCWLMFQEQPEFHVGVLVGKSFENACILLSDLQAELEHNHRIINDFGVQVQEGSWETGQFVTKLGVAMFARGRGQSPRGLRYKNYRVDLWLFDDLDDDELVLNESRVDKLVDWYFEACLGAMNMGKGRVIVMNNLIHTNSFMGKLWKRYEALKQEYIQKGLPHDHIYLVQIDASEEYGQGHSNWERYSDEDIRRMEEELGYRGAQKELYNNPISGGKIFKKEWFQFKKLPKINEYKNLVAYLDGGFKGNKTSDTKALILMGLWKGELHIIKAYVDIATIEQMVDWHYDLDKWLKAQNATCIWKMEEVFLLDLLYKDFRAAVARYGYQIPIGGDKRKKPDKDLRITATAGVFERGMVWFNEGEEKSHHMQRLIGQYYDFEPPKKTHKDGPDAVEGGKFILEEMASVDGAGVEAGKRKSNPKRY